MKIWLTRHGQTNLNKNKLMQGLTDEPLNATGIAQAKKARERIGNMTFDAVYASPLDRAIHTAAVIGNVDKKDVIIDPRIIETDFGKYEKAKYYLMGPAMTLYWTWPEVMPAPKTVETVASMVKRSSEFLKELEKKGYENVLVACHGGIIRALCGYLEDRENGIKWRPKAHNCEVRVYESVDGKHRFIGAFGGDEEAPEELKQIVAEVSAANELAKGVLAVAEPEEEVAEAEEVEPEAEVEEVAEAEAVEPEVEAEEVTETEAVEPEAEVEEVAETEAVESEAKVEAENTAEVEDVEKAETESKAQEPQRLCACCGAPISEKYEVCSVCGWEDDPLQNREPEYAGGANLECLNEYREIYLEKKAREEKAAKESSAE